MVSKENKVIGAAISAGILGFVLLAIIENAIGFPGDWGFVFGFLLFVLFGAIIPQLYLIQTDRSVSRTSRLGVVSLVLVVLAAGFSGEVAGTELRVIWGVVGISIALIIGTEIREGYGESAQTQDQ